MACFHGKKLVETEIFQKRGVADIHIDRAERALPDFAEPQCDPGQGAHECRVHQLTGIQIDHKLPVAPLDHLLDKLFDARAVLECPAPADLEPYRATEATNKNRRRNTHNEPDTACPEWASVSNDGYFHMKDWRSATILPSTIKSARQPVTRPLSRYSSPVTSKEDFRDPWTPG